MEHESIRNKATWHNRKNLSGPQLSRINNSRRNRNRVYKSAKNGAENLISLFEESFIRSLNQTIQKIENNEIEIFHNSSVNSRNIDRSRMLNKIDLPGWDEMEINEDEFDHDFLINLEKITGRHDIISTGSEFTLKAFEDQYEYGYYDYHIGSMNKWFESRYGVIIIMIASFLKQNEMFPGFGGYTSDYYTENIIECMGTYEEGELENNKFDRRMIHEVECSERRMIDYLDYMDDVFNIKIVAKIIQDYAVKYNSKDLRCIGDAIEKLSQFNNDYTDTWDASIEETNLFDMIVWYGNEYHHSHFNNDFNENYGSGQGTFVKFLDDSKQDVINLKTLELWKEMSINPPHAEIIEQYNLILNALQDESNIKEFTRVSGESNLLVDIYTELDRKSGSSEGRDKKWQGVALCTSFSELLKKTRRLCAGK